MCILRFWRWAIVKRQPYQKCTSTETTFKNTDLQSTVRFSEGMEVLEKKKNNYVY